MTDAIRIGSRNAEIIEDLTLIAHPAQTPAGGIVLLVATVNVAGTFAVGWRVEGPVTLTRADSTVALLGATTVAGDEIEVPDGDLPFELRATLDTTPLAVGPWTVTLELANTEPAVARARPLTATAYVEVRQRPFAAGDPVSVSMRRAAVTPTPDQALWVSIRSGADALGFDSYLRFMDRVWCDGATGFGGRRGRSRTQKDLRRADRLASLPFVNADRYRLLKAATEVFLMINCRTDHGDFADVDLEEEGARLNQVLNPGDLEERFRRYLVQTPDGQGGELDVLPYLGLVRRKLGDVPVVGPGIGDDAEAAVCYGILAEKLTNPCFLELIHSYWLERSGLVHAMHALDWRFQNKAPDYPGRNPLAALDIDPLRPLNSLLWGWAQDEQHRLTPKRREREYAHLYGLSLGGRPPQVADSRSRFMAAFHNLLGECLTFYAHDDHTAYIANGFDVLNGLKEVHLLLAQGAHNQYGELPWTTRHEMLMSQWILSRPEIRDFLPSRVMVDSPEIWIDAVEAMNRLHGGPDVSVLHYRDLAAYGEQLLLSIRFGSWTSATDPDRAANWARYFRREVQQYCHAYRAVTGHGLAARPGASANGYARRRPFPAYRG
ncbi:MAG TPA: hypothetical protein VGP16_32875 [Asanoa sp.]|nr:hypothetical protein [Asanoa sp.]